MKQINNLKIKHIPGGKPNEYHIVTPDKRILEEFGTYQGAVNFAKNTKDFTIKKWLPIRSNILGIDTIYTLTHQEARKAIMDNIVSSYTTEEAVDDGYLIKILPNRWEQLTHGKPIMATRNVFDKISLAWIMEMWNQYVLNAKTQEQKELFVTKINNEKVWIMDDGSVFTIMYPEDY